MENIILNLVEKLNEMQERAINAEHTVEDLKNDLERAVLSLQTANAAIAELNEKVAEKDKEIERCNHTISYQYTARQKLEEELKELKGENNGEV